jgi:hypothetical protein
MQHEDHIERYNHSLESLFKENDLALKTLYEYLKNSSIDNMTILKKDVYQDYYYFEVNHNIRNFNPVKKETNIDNNVSIIYNDSTISVCCKSRDYLKNVAEKEFKLNCTIIA